MKFGIKALFIVCDCCACDGNKLSTLLFRDLRLRSYRYNCFWSGITGRNSLYADNKTTVIGYCRHDGYGSVNITVRRCKCKRVCDSRRSPLSRVKYDPLFNSRNNCNDRTVNVGHEIIMYLICCRHTRSNHIQ